MVQGSFPGKGQHFFSHSNVVKYFLVLFLEGEEVGGVRDHVGVQSQVTNLNFL